jgi:hypothetical protein
MDNTVHFDGRVYDLTRLQMRAAASTHRIKPKEHEGPIVFTNFDPGFSCAVLKEGKLVFMTQTNGNSDSVPVLSKLQLKQCIA